MAPRRLWAGILAAAIMGHADTKILRRYQDVVAERSATRRVGWTRFWEAIGVDEDLERELQDEVLGLGKIERRKDADLAAMLSTAIAQIAAVERTGADPNALLGLLRMQRFPEWEVYVLDARSLIGRIHLAADRD